MKTFEQAWAEKEAEGYQYGRDALEQVRFGWELRERQVSLMYAALNKISERTGSDDPCRWMVDLARKTLMAVD